jgi:SAM-dependent methyltransferase
MKLLNAGCGTHYAHGWVNTDIWENEETRPDVLVQPGKPYPFEDDSFDAVMLSHVLEHIKWNEVPDFVNEIRRVAKPEASILIICPDVHKTIKLWHSGRLPWELVESVMEHAEVAPDDKSIKWWDGAAHQWNAHEKRVENLLRQIGFLKIENVINRIPIGNTWIDKGITWPVVGMAEWQLAFLIKNYK